MELCIGCLVVGLVVKSVEVVPSLISDATKLFVRLFVVGVREELRVLEKRSLLSRY